MSEDKLDTILEYLKNMTNRQHIILKLLHKIEEKDIKEFLEDLEIIENIDWDKYWKLFFEIYEKWKKRGEKG